MGATLQVATINPRPAWPAALLVLLMPSLPAVAEAFSEPETWQCRNTVEVHCRDGECASLDPSETTPLHVAFSTTGAFSVCAYTGCWEGDAAPLATEPFLVITQPQAPWSDPARPDGAADVAIVFDRVDRVAVVKAGGFVVPLLCQVNHPTGGRAGRPGARRAAGRSPGRDRRR